MLSGKVRVGRLVRAAVERQRRDLERQGDPAFPYVFEADAGAKVCRFIERFLVHVEGAESLVGKPLILAAFQVWLIVVSWGWKHTVTGGPRFRRIVMFCPKGQGKSTLSAALSAYVLCQDKGASTIVSAATTRDQARIVFDFARHMFNASHELTERFGLMVEMHAVRRPETGAVFKPISSEAKSAEGKLPRLILEDEIHVHPNRDLHDNLRSMAAKRPDSVMVIISTAGADTSEGAIGWEVYRYARDILQGAIEDDSQFALLIEADRLKDTDPFARETWEQANPNLGVSVDPVEVQNEAEEARRVVSKRKSFFIKRLGWWVSGGDSLFDLERWGELARPAMRVEEFDDWMLFLGLDLARTRDLTAAVRLFVRTRDDGKREYRLFTRGTVYLPEKSPTIDLLPNIPIRQWAEDGWLKLLPGGSMSYTPVVEDLLTAAEDRGRVEVCLDEWSAAEVEATLDEAGLAPIAIRQGAKTQSEPTKELEAAILDGRILHDGSPVAAWCLSNTVENLDRNANVAPGRRDRLSKIDVTVATINAMVRAMTSDGGGSAYDEEGATFTWA